MKHTWLITVAAIALATSGALASGTPDSTTHTPPPGNTAGGPPPEGGPGGPGEHHAWTLAEARKHAHDYADKLDKMTDAEWNQKEAKRQAFFDKWNKMTPEEKQAYRDKKHEERMEKKNAMAPGSASAAAPSAGGPAGGTPPASGSAQ